MVGLINAVPPENLEDFKNVFVFIELRNGELSRPGLEMIGAGLNIARKANEKLVGIIIGDNLAKLADEAGSYGCDIVLCAEGKDLKEFRTMPYSHIIGEFINEFKPNILLIPATRNGRDLASRVAVKSKAGVTADCTELDIDLNGRILLAKRPTYGESTLAEILCRRHRPQMATARPGIFKIPEKEEGRKFQKDIRKMKIPEEMMGKEIIEFIPKKSLDLTAAKIVVSGGLGLSKSQGFAVLESLANEIGGVVGASRPTVDLGWIERDHQVGQTGQSVRPDLYIAAGISGKIQHIMGMKLSKNIIAINTDPNAEINQYSDYIINDDLYKAVPALTEEIRKRKEAKK
ncbi:MAG: electron transfer flavoprotein subunit alpha/FixB family protein [Thermoplasmataceae archaeon]